MEKENIQTKERTRNNLQHNEAVMLAPFSGFLWFFFFFGSVAKKKRGEAFFFFFNPDSSKPDKITDNMKN